MPVAQRMLIENLESAFVYRIDSLDEMNTPIRNAGTNCDNATRRKYKLKKNLNCS
jgi:hypothetical protein